MKADASTSSKIPQKPYLPEVKEFKKNGISVRIRPTIKDGVTRFVLDYRANGQRKLVWRSTMGVRAPVKACRCWRWAALPPRQHERQATARDLHHPQRGTVYGLRVRHY